MQFWVKLLKVNETKDQEARDNLYSNCTHVAIDYWLYDGYEEFLDAGIDYTVIGDAAIDDYGDLSGSEIA